MIRDTILELRRLLMVLLLAGAPLGAYVGTVGGLMELVGPSPLLASGVVSDPGVQEEGVGLVATGALYRVHPDCARKNGPHACPSRLIQRYGLLSLHLQDEDGQQVSVAALPSGASFADEDPRDDYLLVVVRPGDRVSAVLRGEQASLTRQSPEEVVWAQRQRGLLWMGLGQLGGLLCAGLYGLLRWLGLQPPPRPAGWYERPLPLDGLLSREVRRGLMMLMYGPALVFFAFGGLLGLLALVIPAPVGTSGGVTEPGDEQEVVGHALWHQSVLVESTPSLRLHLRQSDGQLVEVEVGPPSSGFPDEDPRPDYRLYQVRLGDPVVVRGRELHRGRPEDEAARQRQWGLQMLLMAPVMMLFLAGHGAVIWGYGKPSSLSSSMTSNLARGGSRGGSWRW